MNQVPTSSAGSGFSGVAGTVAVGVAPGVWVMIGLGATDLQQQVNTWLAARQMLLTLDNFEQLLGQAEIGAWVRELLELL